MKYAAISTRSRTPSVSDTTAGRDREFAFSAEDFAALRRLARDCTGITLASSKSEMVYGRLSRRLRVLGLDSFTAYRALLAGPGGRDELPQFINAITTNLTAFFRESHHFDVLRERILQPYSRSPRRLRIWSAGCSTGEEPYSIAMTVAENVPVAAHANLRILATDLDSEVLERARGGRYREDRVEALSPRRRASHFSRSAQDAGLIQINPSLAGLIVFRQLNLMHDLPMKGPFDAIFCRNVLIYFDKDTQRGVLARFARLQRPGDYLFLGHSESLHGVSNAYTLIGKTVYQRCVTT